MLPPSPAVESAPDMSLRVTATPVEGDVPRTRVTPPAATPAGAVLPVQASRVGDNAVGQPRAHGIRVTADRAAHALPITDPAMPAHAAQPPAIVPAAKAPRSDSPLVLSAAYEPGGQLDARIDLRALQTPSLSDTARRLTDDRLTALEQSRGKDVVRVPPAADPRERAAPPVRPPPTPEPSRVIPTVRVTSDMPVGDMQAPAVRITIGRIEVRAVMPQPPAPLPKPVHPSNSSAISLDEYLKQRSGAGR